MQVAIRELGHALGTQTSVRLKSGNGLNEQSPSQEIL
jgi:hypothetical protein